VADENVEIKGMERNTGRKEGYMYERNKEKKTELRHEDTYAILRH
jgi:hypothetical protein